MRSQQNSRRSRNRGGNRRNQNPLSRSYERNGPDVKIRGNPQVIADKYAALARDAMSAGDRVIAENYLQHAEHYNRIILSAQPKPSENEAENDAENSEGDASETNSQAASAEDVGDAPQPVIDGTPAEVAQEEAEAPSREKRQRRPRRKKTEAEDQGEQPVQESVEVASDEPESPIAAE